jgi:hypothetical protein
VQFAGAHAAEFGNGLTILAPVVERAGQVHRKVPFEDLEIGGSANGSGLDLMDLNICCGAKTKRANASCHLCIKCNPQERSA